MPLRDEINQVLDRLHVGIHSSDKDGINYTHWLEAVSFIVANPVMEKKTLSYRLVSVLGIRKRTVDEYIDCMLAWDVLRVDQKVVRYNRTYIEQVDNETTGNPEIDEAIADCDRILNKNGVN